MKRATIALLAVLALFLFAVGAVALAEVTGYLPGPLQGMHARAHMVTHHSWMWSSHHDATMTPGAHQRMNVPRHHQRGMTNAGAMHASQMPDTSCITNAS